MDQRQFIEHGLFFFTRRMKLVGPGIAHFDMAGRTGTGAAAQAADIKAVLADDFHDPPAFHGFHLVVAAGLIFNPNETHSLSPFAALSVRYFLTLCHHPDFV